MQPAARESKEQEPREREDDQTLSHLPPPRDRLWLDLRPFRSGKSIEHDLLFTLPQRDARSLDSWRGGSLPLRI